RPRRRAPGWRRPRRIRRDAAVGLQEATARRIRRSAAAQPGEQGDDRPPEGALQRRRAAQVIDAKGCAMEPDTILYATADGIATITLNRPEALNALLPEMNDRLPELIGQAEADPAVRVIVLTGAGKAFSAGADLKLMGRPDRLGRSALVGRERTLHGAAVV